MCRCEHYCAAQGSDCTQPYTLHQKQSPNRLWQHGAVAWSSHLTHSALPCLPGKQPCTQHPWLFEQASLEEALTWRS